MNLRDSKYLQNTKLKTVLSRLASALELGLIINIIYHLDFQYIPITVFISYTRITNNIK